MEEKKIVVRHQKTGVMLGRGLWCYGQNWCHKKKGGDLHTKIFYSCTTFYASWGCTVCSLCIAGLYRMVYLSKIVVCESMPFHLSPLWFSKDTKRHFCFHSFNTWLALMKKLTHVCYSPHKWLVKLLKF